jgi:hypothetical protein
MALAPLARFRGHRRHTGATEPLRRFRHEVISVTHNEGAKIALGSFRDGDLFVIDYKAPEQTKKQKVAWLRVNYPRVKICGAESLQGPTPRCRLQHRPE